MAEDVARIAAVREAVGDDWDIMVDANQGFSVPEAIRRARAFEPLDIAWLEEPIHADDVHAHRRLSASTTVPIAVGESLYSLSQFRTICRATPARWCRWTWAASAASRRG